MSFTKFSEKIILNKFGDSPAKCLIGICSYGIPRSSKKLERGPILCKTKIGVKALFSSARYNSKID